MSFLSWHLQTTIWSDNQLVTVNVSICITNNKFVIVFPPIVRESRENYFQQDRKIDQKSLNVIRATIISSYDPWTTYLFEAEIGHSPPWDTVAGAEVIIVINTRKPEGLHSLRKHCVGYVSGYSSTDQTRPVDADDPRRNESVRTTVSIDTIMTSVTSQYDSMTSQSNQQWCCHANTVSRPKVSDLGCVPHRLSWRPPH